MHNHYKITYADLRDVIESHCIALISKAQMYDNSQTNSSISCKISVDLQSPRLIKEAVEIERSEDEILVTFTITPSQDTSAEWSLEGKSGFRFTKDRVYRLNYTYGTEREINLNNNLNGIHPEESIVLLALYQRLAHEIWDNESSVVHAETNTEESKTVEPLSDKKFNDIEAILEQGHGNFLLELNIRSLAPTKDPFTNEQGFDVVTATSCSMGMYPEENTTISRLSHIMFVLMMDCHEFFRSYFKTKAQKAANTAITWGYLRKILIDSLHAHHTKLIDVKIEDKPILRYKLIGSSVNIKIVDESCWDVLRCTLGENGAGYTHFAGQSESGWRDTLDCEIDPKDIGTNNYEILKEVIARILNGTDDGFEVAVFEDEDKETEHHVEIDMEEYEKSRDNEEKPKTASINTVQINEGKLVSHVIPEDKLKEIHRLLMTIIYNHTTDAQYSFNDFLHETAVKDLLNAMMDANTIDLSSH